MWGKQFVSLRLVGGFFGEPIRVENCQIAPADPSKYDVFDKDKNPHEESDNRQ